MVEIELVHRSWPQRFHPDERIVHTAREQKKSRKNEEMENISIIYACNCVIVNVLCINIYFMPIAICMLTEYWINDKSSVAALNNQPFFGFQRYR